METVETEPSNLPVKTGLEESGAPSPPVETEPSNLPVKRGLEEIGAPSPPQKKQRQEQMMEVEVKKKKRKKKNNKGNNSSTSTKASSSSQENNSSEEPPKDNEIEMVENVEEKEDQEMVENVEEKEDQEMVENVADKEDLEPASQPTTQEPAIQPTTQEPASQPTTQEPASLPPTQEKPTDARTDESGFTAALVNKGTTTSPTAVVGLDCEMVGVGYRGIKGSLARVSVVGGDGRVLLDRYVRPKKRVTDYRTRWSGIKPEHLKEGHDFMKVRREVKAVLQNAIVVGHDLKHDFDVLLLNPRQFKIRDTSIYEPFRELMGSHLTPSLKRLTQKVLGVAIQAGDSGHSSIQDAQAAVQLYNEYSVAWEERLENGLEMAHDIKPEMSMQRKLLDMSLNKKKLARRMRRVQKKKKKKVRTKKTHTGRTRI